MHQGAGRAPTKTRVLLGAFRGGQWWCHSTEHWIQWLSFSLMRELADPVWWCRVWVHSVSALVNLFQLFVFDGPFNLSRLLCSAGPRWDWGYAALVSTCTNACFSCWTSRSELLGLGSTRRQFGSLWWGGGQQAWFLPSLMALWSSLPAHILVPVASRWLKSHKASLFFRARPDSKDAKLWTPKLWTQSFPHNGAICLWVYCLLDCQIL